LRLRPLLQQPATVLDQRAWRIQRRWRHDTKRGLLESQGYRATDQSQIVAETGTPKGSLYHCFPQVKEQLVAEAVAGDL
jgi:AcrR family transcriptional regulator